MRGKTQFARKDARDEDDPILDRNLRGRGRPRSQGRVQYRKSPRLPANSRLVSPPREYILEYQDGSTAEHYRATDESINLERVADALSKYLRRDESWKSDFRWKKLAIRKPNSRRDRHTRS